MQELDSKDLVPYKISTHRICRGISGKTAVQYYTQWTGIDRCTWEHEVELEQYGDVVLKYWADQPQQSGGGNILYRRYRVQIAKRAVAHKKGERHVPRGYKLCCDDRGRPSVRSRAMIGSYIYFRTVRAGWQFAKVVQVTPDPEWERGIKHTIKLVDIGKNINVALLPEKLTTDELVIQPGTWCWHLHVTQKSVKKYMFELEED